MKLVITVVEDNDVAFLMESLVKNGYKATKLASTGGFLLQGNTTLLIGVQDHEVDPVLEIIRSTCAPMFASVRAFDCGVIRGSALRRPFASC